jgi:hypothetical protein
VLHGHAFCCLVGNKATTCLVVHGLAFSGLGGNEVTTWCGGLVDVHIPSIYPPLMLLHVCIRV